MTIKFTEIKSNVEINDEICAAIDVVNGMNTVRDLKLKLQWLIKELSQYGSAAAGYIRSAEVKLKSLVSESVPDEQEEIFIIAHTNHIRRSAEMFPEAATRLNELYEMKLAKI